MILTKVLKKDVTVSFLPENITMVTIHPIAENSDLDSTNDSHRQKYYNERKSSLRGRTAAICAVALDEEKYIDEWVDYNLAIGFQGLYIYDNGKNNVLKKWQLQRKDNRIKVIHHPSQEAPQFSAYNNCARKAMKDGFYWAAFFDVDEYLVLKKHEYVAGFLKEYCLNGSVGVNWKVFGTANHSLYQPIPVLKRFQYYTPNSTINEHIKSIVRLRDFNRTKHPHYTILKKGFKNKNTNGQIIKGPYMDPVYDVAALHHYRTKSREEYIQKTVRGRADLPPNYTETALKIKDAIEGKLDVGTTFDDSAWKVLRERVPKYKIYEKE